jgi:hypothetical protein
MLVECEPIDEAYFASAPQRFHYDVLLPVTPEQLFQVFDDPTSWPSWAPGIANVEWTSPKPFGPGTTRTVTFWGGMEVYEDFFLYESPRQMAFGFTGTSEPVWRSFGELYQVSEHPDGCRLQWTVAYEPIGPFGRAHFLIKPLMRIVLGWYMTRLRRYCQRNRSSELSKAT